MAHPINNKKVMLIGWDAADWKVIHPLMDAGKMPNVQRLVSHGVMGQIATLQPALSPMLWTSIATGKRPFQHGIHGFSEPTPDGRDVQPVTNLSRKCKAVWNILNQNHLRSIVIGWWPSHPAEPVNGVMISDHYHRARGPLQGGSFQERWPLLPGTVHPPELSETLAELRMHPEEIFGPMVEAFVPKAAEVDQSKDRRLASLAKILSECVSIHSAATWLLDHETWDFFAVYYDAIDHFCHGFMRYNPPRQAHISEQDFDRYEHVVSMAYQFHDQMLGTLLSKIGDDVTVILMSDHGFHPDHLRPKAIPRIPAGPAIEHRDFGIFAARGPGIKQDELIYGAGVLDITPTLLSLYGLPIGDDMDGKVLAGIFENPPIITTIPSWEAIPGPDGRHPPHTRLDPVAARESMDQLVALGYIARPGEDKEKAVADTLAELRYNLGQAYQDAGRHAEAAEIFRELRRNDPDEQRFAVHLFMSCQALNLVAEMGEIVDDLDGRRRGLFEEAQEQLKTYAELVRQRRQQQQAAPQTDPLLTKEEFDDCAKWQNLSRFQPPVIDYLRAQVLTMEGWYGKALESLERVTEAHLARPGLFLQTADLYRKMGQWNDAENTYVKALAIDPDNPHAHLGIARLALRKRDPAAAAHSALDCIQRLYQYPTAHFLLGVALTQLKDYRRAADAFRVALSQNPNFPQAHLRLAMLLGRKLNDSVGSAEHLRLFRELRASRVKTRTTAQPAPKASSAVQSPERVSPTSFDLPPVRDEIIVISGLPRSGTSMLMQMVAAGGVPVLTDEVRQADEDNPRGYFEFQPVKNLHRDAEWLNTAKGQAVKVVAPLLPQLPAGFQYRIIFINRNLDQILSSQAQMLRRHQQTVEDTPERRARLKEEYSKLLVRVTTLLTGRSDVQVLFLDREDVLLHPSSAARRINRFLGGRLNEQSMAEAVVPSLDRQKAQL
jgi:predicted AlkP superfamily phosphohydrolase/phosphomutase/tetratricopeptide (TPR) repeat protein